MRQDMRFSNTSNLFTSIFIEFTIDCSVNRGKIVEFKPENETRKLSVQALSFRC